MLFSLESPFVGKFLIMMKKANLAPQVSVNYHLCLVDEKKINTAVLSKRYEYPI